MNKHIKIIGIQAIFLIMVFIGIYFAYPKVDAKIQGNSIIFDSANANIITISKSPDFSNPRYLGIDKHVSITLKPGTYYWKASNNLIAGLTKKFTIKSEVGLKIEDNENESELVNIGNVKLNVTKSKEGIMIGHIILEPNEKEKIENEGEYTGRQEN